MSEQLEEKLKELKSKRAVASDSGMLFVDDGSSDGTRDLIKTLAGRYDDLHAISFAKNYGHQTALYAGMLEARGKADIVITLDADGQHNLAAVDKMISSYNDGNEIVCAVRNNKKSEALFKRATADVYYRLLTSRGVRLIKGHSDYRLVSKKAIGMLEKMPKRALFLRGDFLKLPLKTASVEYECMQRAAGRSKYSINKMMKLALAGLKSNRLIPEKSGSSSGLIEYEIVERL